MESREQVQALRRNIEQTIKGKPEAVKMAVVTLLSRGHLLIEDVPGVGKTTLAASLARSIDCAFKRIQFTSDLLPADILHRIFLKGSSPGQALQGADAVMKDDSIPIHGDRLLQTINTFKGLGVRR